MNDRDDHVGHYRAEGYAVLRGVLATAEVAELAHAIDNMHREAVAHPRSFRDRNTFIRLGQDPALGKIVRFVQWPSYGNPVFERYRRHERLLRLLAPLIGTDLKQIINQVHWKPPGATAAEFGYHQDVRFRRPRSAFRDLFNAYVQTAIAIDPHRPENGAMKVYPRSHLMGEIDLVESGSVMSNVMSAVSLERVGLDPARAVDLVLEPGDVALWNPFTIHGSGPNRSHIDRRTYINGYVAAAQCDRGEWTLRNGVPCALGEPVLVHYEDLFRRSDPHYVDEPDAVVE